MGGRACHIYWTSYPHHEELNWSTHKVFSNREADQHANFVHLCSPVCSLPDCHDHGYFLAQTVLPDYALPFANRLVWKGLDI